jgi:hypothetical protein
MLDLSGLDLEEIGNALAWVWYQDMADFAQAITDERAVAGWPGHPGQRRLPPVQGRAPRRVPGPPASVVRIPRHPSQAPVRPVAADNSLVDGRPSDPRKIPYTPSAGSK